MLAAVAIPGLVQIGETLRTAREVRGLSLDQAAATLRCDARVIDALEGGRFEDLGPPVFARGHLLRYAALLGEPGEAMVEEWSQLAAGGAGAELMHGLQGPRGRDLRQVRRRLVTAAALLSLVAIAVWSLQNLPKAGRSVGTPAAASAQTAPAAASAPSVATAKSAAAAALPAAVVATSPQAAIAAPIAPVSDPAIDLASAPASTTSSTPAIALASPAAIAAGPTSAALSASSALPRGVARLSLAFSADSWLEIYDSRNRRLFFGLARPGAAVEVRGPAPLRVLVGNAPAAILELNGRRVEVPRDAMRGPRAAALRVNADGRLIALPRA